MARKPLQIAIDGPIGSGKSTVAQKIARRLRVLCVDAGALYRTAAYIALRDGLSPKEAQIAAQRFRQARVVQRAPVGKENDGRKNTLLLDGKDISWEIRTHAIDDFVAKVSQDKTVIAAVHEKEREMANTQDVVIEGREIGTLVLPAATVKVYLTAAAEKRAARRFAEYQGHGDPTPEHEIVRALKERDELDMRRLYAPLRKADDAVLIDTTDRTVEEVVEMILQLVPGEYFTSPAGSAGD